MGEKAREIVRLDVDELIEQLNKALADEWLAYYQYWVGSKIVEGRMAPSVAAELIEHANEELAHANMLVERIIQLGGKPILNPKQFSEKTNCGYAAPDNPDSLKVVEQNLEGERCAIEVYNKILDIVRGKDEITFKLVLKIMEDEVEHEEDLETILKNLKSS